jgi:hypothetical protein
MKMKTILLARCFCRLQVFSHAAIAQEEFKPITVFLIRHAEREDEPRQDPPLEERRRRAFAGARTSAQRRRHQSDLHVAVRTRRNRLRSRSQQKLGLTVTSFTLKSNPSNPRLIAAESTAGSHVNKILERAGESVLVIGHSNSIPDVIKMLGGDTCPDNRRAKFDDLFIVTFMQKAKRKWCNSNMARNKTVALQFRPVTFAR